MTILTLLHRIIIQIQRVQWNTNIYVNQAQPSLPMRHSRQRRANQSTLYLKNMSAHRRRRRGFNNETLTTYRFSNNVVAGNIVVANAVVDTT